jgi:glycosyltransferase involved in cell wall biosynthesis
MRILHVVPTYLPAVRYGGPIFAIHGLCRALVSRGHEIQVFTTNINGREKSGVSVGVPVWLDGVQVRYFSSPFLKRLSWAPSLKHALSSEIADFDLIHLHSVFLWPTWAAARLARRAQVPYLISPRGMLVKNLIERRSSVVKKAWIRLIERSNLEHASAIHVTSEVEDAELKRFNWKLPQVATIPNGIEELQSKKIAEPSGDVADIASLQPLVLFFGRISWKKGLERLLNAFALTPSGTLAVVGNDDEGLVPELQLLAEKLRISDRVRFLPRTVLGDDKEHLFRASRLFVLASYSENFGNAVLEALQRGVPAVVTPEVGAANIVRDAAGGIVTGSKPEQLAGAISELLADSGLAQVMGDAGRRYVIDHFGWSQIAAKMESLYESVKYNAHKQ